MSAETNPDTADEFTIGLDSLPDSLGDVAATPLVPLDLIVLIAWHNAGGPRLIARMKRGQAIVIEVPSESWYDPLTAIIKREKTGTVVFEGKRKGGDKKSSDAFVAELLQDGRGAVGISVEGMALEGSSPLRCRIGARDELRPGLAGRAPGSLVERVEILAHRAPCPGEIVPVHGLGGLCRALLVRVGPDQAGIDGEAFAADQPLRDAAPRVRGGEKPIQ